MCAITLARAPSCRNCFVAAGLNSIGLQSAGGIGKVVSEWIRDGHPPIDLWEVDVRRNMPFQINRKYLQARVQESLGLLYATHWPFRQYETARGVRKSAVHDRLAQAGACFGEAFGWERANWYAPVGRQGRVRIQLWPPELVRAQRARASRGARARWGSSISPRSPNSGSRAPMPRAC